MKWGEFMYDVRYLNNDENQIYNNNGFFNNQNGNMNNNSSCSCYKSYFRVLNAIADAPALDVHVNEMLIVSNLKYGEFSRYMKFMPGNYTVTVYPSGNQTKAIIETNITIDRNLAYTGALSGEMSDITNLSIYMIPEAKETNQMNRMAAVKFIDLSPDGPSLKLISSDGTILFSEIEYGDVTDNVALPAGTYTLNLRATDSDKNILTVPNIDFAPRMYYTLFVIGKYGVTPKLEMLIPEDGLNYLDLC